MMKQKRIEEVKTRLCLYDGSDVTFCEDAHDLLDALEKAQAENERLREALRTAHRIALKRVGFRVKNELTLLEEACRICREMFLNGRGQHADDCPFKILEDGDNVMVCGETSNG